MVCWSATGGRTAWCLPTPDILAEFLWTIDHAWFASIISIVDSAQDGDVSVMRKPTTLDSVSASCSVLQVWRAEFFCLCNLISRLGAKGGVRA